jgi:4-hydroxybenzoate polyprenyltransferase
MKNLLLFAPIFFSGSTSVSDILKVTGATFCFCLASSLGYILNDWIDKDKDSRHHEKCNRPFCSGAVSGKKGLLITLIISVILILCINFLKLPDKFLLYLFCYLFLTGAYSLRFKHVPVLEIFIVSFGFVLRVLAGGAACDIIISDWLFLTILFMSMLITVTKRKVEFDHLKKQADSHRESLASYNSNYLHNYLWAIGGVTLVVYALYTVEKGDGLVYSVLPATYGIVRFFLLTDKGLGGDPIKTLFKDIHLVFTCLIFIGFISFRIYIY